MKIFLNKPKFQIVLILGAILYFVFYWFLNPVETAKAIDESDSGNSANLIKNEVHNGAIKTHRQNPTGTPIASSPDQVLLDYAFSPDGSRLAVYTNRNITIVDLRDKKETIFLEFETDEFSKLLSGAVAFSPDGKQIAVSGKTSNEAIQIFDLETKKEIYRIDNLPEDYYVTEIEYTPDGKTLMVRNTHPNSIRCESAEDAIYLIDLVKGQKIYEIAKCVIYPPLKIQMLTNRTATVFYKYMAPDYSVFTVDTGTGEVISKDEFNYDNDGTDFYEVSNDGRYRLLSVLNDASHKYRDTIIYDAQDKREVVRVEGKIIFYKDLGRHIVEKTFRTEDGKLNSDYSFLDNGKTKCEFENMVSYEPLKTNIGRDVVATYSSSKEHAELHVWTVSNCGRVYDQVFDN